jgi:putative spermidine/putrescine transport system permease protein
VAVEVAADRTGVRHRVGPRAPIVNRWLVLALPPLVFLGVVFLYPLYLLLKQSFTEPTFGLSNYETFFGTGVYVTVLIRTLTISLVVTAICVLLGYPYAYLMAQSTPTWRRILIFLVLMPLWTSMLIRTYAWTVLLQDTGVINKALIGLGIIDSPLHLIRTTTGVIIGMSQVLLPFMVLPLYANLRSIDPAYMRAASGLGAKPLTGFRRVYLPMSYPGIAAGSLIVFIYALGFYITPALLGGPSNAMLSQIIVTQMSQLLNFGLGSAMAGVLLVLTLAVVALLSRIARTERGYEFR